MNLRALLVTHDWRDDQVGSARSGENPLVMARTAEASQ
jgi:hypothetical protein